MAQVGRHCYVYAHIREDKNEPFYIGIGSSPNFKRAFTTYGRNSMWHKIASKTNCHSNVLFTNLSWKEAVEIEINLISHLGRINLKTGSLCNLTNGGEGNSGAIFSEERRKNISNAIKGTVFNDERRFKCTLRNQTEETKEKIRLNKTGLKANEETRNKMRITNMVGINAAAKKISKKVINTETGQIFNSVKEAANSINISKQYLCGMMLGRYKNNTNFTYHV